MKILFIIESLGGGGKERRLISLIKELDKHQSFHIDLLLLKKNIHFKEIHDYNVNLHFLKRNIKKDIGILTKFNKLIKTIQPDIVHCWDNIAALHFAPICKFRNIKFINSMITSAPPRLSFFSLHYFFYAISYPFSDVILTNSKAGLYSFRVPKHKGKVIYNGIDFSRVKIKQDAGYIRKQLNIGDKKVIGMTASFTDKKDYNTFVKAGELVLARNNNVIFMAIGGGPNLEKIKKSVQSVNKKNFIFLGKQQDVESLVNIFDIGVLSTYTEGISNAIMEYMIFKKPVIATGGGGTQELVVENKTGYILESQNPELMAEKMLFLLDNPEIAAKFGENGAERIKTVFSMEKMINQTYELYKEICLNKKVKIGV